MYFSKEKKFFWFLFFIFVFLVLLLLLFYYIFFKTSLLEIKDIKINEVSLISKEDALNFLKKEIIIDKKIKSLISDNNLLFFVGVNKENILNRLIYFQDFNIKINFLKKEIFINFKEREAIGIFCFLNNVCYLFDKDGVIFKKAPYLEGGVILKIYSNNDISYNLLLGQKLFSNENYLSNILKVYQVLKDNNFTIKKVVLKDLKYKEFDIVLVNNLVLKFSLDNIPQDFDLLIKKIKKEFDFNLIKFYLDFRVENRIFYY